MHYRTVHFVVQESEWGQEGKNRPHRYGRIFRGQAFTCDAESYARAIVEKAAELGIEVLAITDHNSMSSVEAFRAAAEGKDIYIFPGFELASSEGVHVLCIYGHDTPNEVLNRYLGAFGIVETRPSAGLAAQSFAEILAKVPEQGGLAIAAHVTNENGLFKVLSGQARIRAWRDPNLLAVQIPGPIEDLPQEIREIIESRNPEYRREHPAEERQAIAVINAKDVATPADLEDRPATCWIKMSDVSVEGLRQAFLDPGSRIRLNPKAGDLEPERHAELVALAWEGGFLDGVAIHFNPNLNVLVAGRGTGKSTVIESIRTVLGLEPIGDDARKAHEGILREVLRNGTKISLLVRVHRPAVLEYRIERTLPNPPLVREEGGEISDLTPVDILPRVEVYGRHEISELTKSREKLTRLPDRFVERDASLDRQKASLRRELEKNRRELCDTRNDIHELEERLASLPALEETLKRFQEAGLEERLKEQSLLVREERVLDSVAERLAPFRDSLDILKGELPIERTFLSEGARKDLPGKEILSRANEVLAELEGELLRVACDLEEALKRAEEGIARVRSSWEARKRQVQEQYEKILRELQKSSVDGEEFIRLRRGIEELELAPTTAIRLNTAPAGSPPLWQALENLSTGQKATAVLLLLLLESDAPLIVDQPEDDLDNRFITEGIVPRIREEKRKRPFIFSTHNANIPVLGDAELILGLSASGEADGNRARIAPEHMGSIDSPTVRALVEEVLEGGREAFETRRRKKYGF